MMQKLKMLCALMAVLFALPGGAQDVEPLPLHGDGQHMYGGEVPAAAADTLLAAAELPLPTWEQQLQAKLSRLLQDDLFQTSQLGLMVWDMDADSVLYAHNHRHRMRPASTLKVLTAVAALDRLGSGYQFRTQLRMKQTGQPADSTGQVSADFYLVGGMDPLFGGDDMKAFVDAVKALGADTIRGHVYADLSFKDKARLGEGWCWDDDNPSLSPLLVSRKDDFVQKFLRRLRDAHIVMEVETGEATAPAAAALLCERTHSLQSVMRRMLKDSDNLHAESVFYQVAHAVGGRHAAAKSAKQTVLSLVSRSGAPSNPVRIADGSGLSLYNYVTPETEVRVLRYAYQHPDIYDQLRQLLPVAAVDGTLGGRMGRTAAAGNVRAKTGTVTGVSSLAGYCTGGNGHRLCFSIINQGVQGSSAAHRFQDKVCVALCSR